MSDTINTPAKEPPFNLATALKAIHKDQDVKEWSKFQEEERRKLAEAMKGLDSVSTNYQHGVRAVEIGKNEIKGLRKKDPDYLTRLTHERDRIAEGYALQGQFEKAVEWAVERKAEYQDLLDALVQPPCAHKEQFAKQRFYRDGVKTLMSCPKCGNSFVE